MRAIRFFRGLTATERNWLKAAGLVAGSVLLFYGILGLETAWAARHRTERLVYHPVETSMRCLAIPHFLIAILFTATSRKMQRARSWLGFLGLAAAGAGLCLLFAKAGGREGMISKALFITYFAIHEFRDEAYFCAANGDAPGSKDARRLSPGVFVAPVALLWFALGIAAIGAAFGIGGMGRYTGPLFGEMPARARGTLGLLPMLAFAGCAWWLVRRARRVYPGGVRAFLQGHRPILRVFAGIFLLILIDLVLYGKIRALVTLHVTAWYVFTVQMLDRRPAAASAPRTLGWTWMRTTRAGFVFLHVGLFVAVTVGCAVWAWGFRNAPSQHAFRLLLSREAFPYWTILHITLSFLPR
ncbi:MAG: hypothetical protein ACT4PV_11755 [Planctomycetaceae bacterium]